MMIKSLYKLTFPWIIVDGRKILFPAMLLRLPLYILMTTYLLYRVPGPIWPYATLMFLAVVALSEGMLLLDALAVKDGFIDMSRHNGNRTKKQTKSKDRLFGNLMFAFFSPMLASVMILIGGDLIWKYLPTNWSYTAFHHGLNFFSLHALAMQSFLLVLMMIALANFCEAQASETENLERALKKRIKYLQAEVSRLRYENKILKEDLNSLQQEAIGEEEQGDDVDWRSQLFTNVEDDEEDFDWWSYLLADIRDYLDKGSHKGHFWEDVAFEIWPSEEVGEIINWYNVSVSEHQSKVVMEEEWISGSHLLYLIFKERKIAISLNHTVADYDAVIAGLLTVVQPDVELRRCTLLNPPTLLPLAPEDWQEVEIICGKANIERCFVPVLAGDRVIADYIKLTNGWCYYGA